MENLGNYFFCVRGEVKECLNRIDDLVNCKLLFDLNDDEAELYMADMKRIRSLLLLD